jgi:hypothetical protein
MKQYDGWKKTVKLIILLVLLAMGAAVYVSCGEQTLLQTPPGSGKVIITGGAV